MGKVEILLASAATLFALSTANAQFADIPEFLNKYEVDVDLVSIDGEVFWTSKKFDNNVQELRGHVDLDASFLFFGVSSFYLGLVAEIDKENQTIKNIVYDNGNSDEHHISEYDKKIIQKYSLNPKKVMNITSELIDYKNKKVIDLETMLEQPLYDNEVGFQEGYFILKDAVNKDTTMAVHYRGEHYNITTKEFFDYDEKRRAIYIDLTIPDPENPRNRKNILNDIDYLKLYIDKDGIPDKVITTINLLFGIGAEASLIK